MDRMFLEKSLALTEEEIFARLGSQLAGMTIADDDPRRAIFGRRWWRDNQLFIQGIVCASKDVRDACAGPAWDRIVAVSAVADALAAFYGMPAAITAGALVVRQGLLEFCGNIWEG